MIHKTWMAQLLAFIRLGRFPFLVGGFVFYGLGAAISFYQGVKINGTVYLWGQLIVTATQLMVHFSNDYFDLAADQANQTPIIWSGGSRVLAENRLSPRVALGSAIVLGSIALAGTLGLALYGHLDSFIFFALLLSIGLAWFYSAPPVRLHSHGIGEISATFVLSVLTPTIGFYLQSGRLTLIFILAIIPLCFLQFNMLISVAVPDAESDARVAKRTLVVLLGQAASARLYLLMLTLVYLVLPILVWGGLPTQVAIVFMCSFPLAVWLGWLMTHRAQPTPKDWSRIAFLSIAVLISSAVFELSAFVGLALR